MEPNVDLFEAELSGRRERYNTLFALARRVRPRLDGELFKHHLLSLVAPIVASLPTTESEAARPVIEALYDLCLELTGSDLFRRSEAALDVWRRLLPLAGPMLLEMPQMLPAALTNAAYNVEAEETAQSGRWLEIMERHRAECDSPRRWLQVGQVASWLCGLAHYRESAIALGRELPEPLRLALCPAWDAVVADPWHPLRATISKPEIVHRLGGFVGFGGRFQQPPWVAYAGEGRFVVEDGGEEYVLSSDAFGATLRPGLKPEIEVPARYDVRADDDGIVTWGDHNLSFEELAPVRSFAASPHLLAVTSERSHHVYLLLGPKH